MAEGGPRATRPRPPTSLCRLQGGGEVHQPLDLDAVARSHVSDVVEVRGSADHLGPTVRISKIRVQVEIISLSESWQNIHVWSVL